MSKFSHKIIGVVAGLLLIFTLQAADEVAVNPDHPERYTVQVGDTLWDIAGLFLQAPWKWPEVWQVNPQIANPHLIYPGDIIFLSYDANGRPQLSLERNGMGVVKLSPKVRSEALSQAIPTIPLDVIQPFLTRPYVVEPGSLETAPYVLGFSREHIASGAGQKIYIRNSGRPLEEAKYHVVRPGKNYVDAGTGEILGQEAQYIGEVLMVRGGDPSTVEVVSSDLEIVAGDRLIPMAMDRPISRFFPKAPDSKVRCSIISVVNGVSQIGQYNVVALDCGEDAGIKQGDVMMVGKKGYTVNDHYFVDTRAPHRRIRDRMAFFDGEISHRESEKWIIPDPKGTTTLPEEPIGTLMVFRAFPRVSFALVLKANDTIHVLDMVQNPVTY